MRAIFIFSIGSVVALFLFFFYSHAWPVQLLGAAMILWFFWVSYRSIQIQALHTKAFGLPAPQMAPQLKLLGIVRLHAEAAEDRIFFAVSSQTILIVLMAIALWQPWWLCVAAMLMTFGSFRAIRRGWPGYALILGGSNQASARAATLLVQRLFVPLNVTNLLAMTAHSEIDDELFRVRSYRLRNEFVSWKAAVEIHAVFSKVIVLDMTHLTRDVLEEFELMRGPDFWYKTAFLCPTVDSQRTVEPLLDEHPTALVVYSLEDLRAKLLELRSRFPAAPSPDQEISILVSPIA